MDYVDYQPVAGDQEDNWEREQPNRPKSTPERDAPERDLPNDDHPVRFDY